MAQLFAREEQLFQKKLGQHFPPSSFTDEGMRGASSYSRATGQRQNILPEFYEKLYQVYHTALLVLDGRAPFTDLSQTYYIIEVLHSVGLSKKDAAKLISHDHTVMGDQARLQELNALYSEYLHRQFEREYRKAFALAGKTELYFPPHIVDAAALLESSLRRILLKMPVQRIEHESLLTVQFEHLRTLLQKELFGPRVSTAP
jgi:hypothetical protein